MARKNSRPEVSRRKFLAGVAVAGAATATIPQNNANAAPTSVAPRLPSALPPNYHTIATETGTPGLAASRIGGRPGSDFMVDVIKTLDIKYLPSNCASSFRGLHESLINYGDNKMPEFLTVTHEEFGVAHGARLLQDRRQADDDAVPRHGRPAARRDGDLQRLVRPGAGDHRRRQRSRRGASGRRACRPSTRRRTSTRWCATSPSGTTRRSSLQHFAQSFVRAYKIAMTPPYGPVAISLDAGLQQEPIEATTARSSISRATCRPRRRRAIPAPSRKPPSSWPMRRTR